VRGPTGRLKRAFVAREAKKLSRKAGTRVLRVGLLRFKFYRTLAKGRKAHKRTSKNGLVYKVSASKASHPEWNPASRLRYEQRVIAMTKQIFRSKRGEITAKHNLRKEI